MFIKEDIVTVTTGKTIGTSICVTNLTLLLPLRSEYITCEYNKMILSLSDVEDNPLSFEYLYMPEKISLTLFIEHEEFKLQFNKRLIEEKLSKENLSVAERVFARPNTMLY